METQKYIKKIKETNIKTQISLKEYLEESLKSDEKYLRGWDYLENNLTNKLRDILEDENYNKIVYNYENVNFIKKSIGIDLGEELSKQLGTFVYIWKDIKQNYKNEEQENILNEDMVKKGFILNENLNIESLENLEGLKVKCVLDISKVGIFGSFTSIEEQEGKFIYSGYYKGLMLIPKRNRTKGFLIKKRFYYKIMKGGKN